MHCTSHQCANAQGGIGAHCKKTDIIYAYARQTYWAHAIQKLEGMLALDYCHIGIPVQFSLQMCTSVNLVHTLGFVLQLL